MHSINELQDIIKRTFASLPLSKEPDELYDPIVYTMNLGGKRIRPMLVLMGCDLFKGNIEKAIPTAIAVELFHNFTLLHDDIMDNAPLRRGKDTVWKRWNNNVAILSGDTMFTLAYEYVSQVDKDVLPQVLTEFTETARMVCEGQQYDMNFESQSNVSISDYLEMIRLKTAVLIGCSLKLGAILANAPGSEIDKISSFGQNIGLAFQLQDDLLDSFGDEKKFGKEIGGDIVSGKKTFLLLKAMEVASTAEKTELDICFTDKQMPPPQKITRVRNIYNSLNIKDVTIEEINRYFSQGLKSLMDINNPDSEKTVLYSFATELLKRDS